MGLINAIKKNSIKKDWLKPVVLQKIKDTEFFYELVEYHISQEI